MPTSARYLPATRTGVLVGLWVVALYWGWFLTIGLGPRGPEGWLGVDSFAYWYGASNPLYEPNEIVREGQLFGRYLYSPVFAQLVWPLAQLPWELFALLWSGAAAAIFIWMLKPLPVLWSIPLFILLCLEEVMIGNVRAFIGLALILALKRPAWWAVPILTKVASGVGLLWHPWRSEWRHLFTALGGTAAIVAVSFAFDPALWVRWFDYMTSGVVTPPDGFVGGTIRLALAVAITGLAARSGQAWWLPVATALASPVLYLADTSYLAAIPRLHHASEEFGSVGEGTFGRSSQR
jgi:hypothetical protein